MHIKGEKDLKEKVRGKKELKIFEHNFYQRRTVHLFFFVGVSLINLQ